jgi:hypothetical protein
MDEWDRFAAVPDVDIAMASDPSTIARDEL